MLTMVHLVGFGGSALIILAVMMRSVVWLRLFAFAGSVAFIVYGAALGAWPVVVTNGFTTTIHLVQLRRLVCDVRASRSEFSISPRP